MHVWSDLEHFQKNDFGSPRTARGSDLVGTPGSGFGAAGEGYFRLSAFNSRANVEEAVRRFQQLVG